MPPDPSHDEKLEQAERLQQLGRVSGELLHDLGGFLAVVSGRVSLAVEEARLGRLAMEELTRIQQDTEDLRRMVLEVMQELRGSAFSPENTFPVATTLEQVVNRWVVGAPAVTTTLHSSLAPEVEVAGPSTFFVRAMANLLRNGARHARSEVRLTLTPVRDDTWIEILVEDNGDGVPDDLVESAFEPFVSGGGFGTGLGLSFAKWGLERLGGELLFNGRARGLGGASFQVLLPMAPLGRRARQRQEGETWDGPEPASPASPRVLARPDGPLSGLAIAVVDDDLAVRQVFVRLLNRAGAMATGLDPGGWREPEEALAHLERQAPDVVLLDLNLGPFGGMEVYGVLVEAAPDLARRVLFLTGGNPPEPAPDRPVLSKLVTWDELASRIRAVADEEHPEA